VQSGTEFTRDGCIDLTQVPDEGWSTVRQALYALLAIVPADHLLALELAQPQDRKRLEHRGIGCTVAIEVERGAWQDDLIINAIEVQWHSQDEEVIPFPCPPTRWNLRSTQLEWYMERSAGCSSQSANCRDLQWICVVSEMLRVTFTKLGLGTSPVSKTLTCKSTCRALACPSSSRVR
jgi:hypothetical protein